ncbi:MAG: hypothetical protein J6B45_02910 [Clostridia bacterium]|nr:hypothetical protein [Clostridia bacterium]
MKKCLSLILAAIMLLTLLMSCAKPQGNGVSSFDGTSQDSVGDNSIKPTSSLPSVSSDTPPKEDEGQSEQPSSNQAQSPSDPPSDSQGENPSAPAQSVVTSTWQYTYDYGFHQRNFATLLVDYGYLRGDFEGIIEPEDIVAGDSITVEYTGSVLIEEKYPSSISLNGEVKSVTFNYAEVVHLVGMSHNLIEQIKAYYTYSDAMVILDRSGNFTTLDEYKGGEIYLVTDQKRYAENEKAEIPSKRYPIACMLAYNPRDLEAGKPPSVPPEKITAELRNKKVSIDLDRHDLYDYIDEEFKDYERFYAGYIGKNKNGNAFIEYAPNIHKYTVLISYTDESGSSYPQIKSKISKCLANDSYSVAVDLQEVSSNQILLTFPDFDTYFSCQETLLNELSLLDCVEKIHVSYIGAQNGSVTVENPYEIYADLSSTIVNENRFFATYNEFYKAFGSKMAGNDGLKRISQLTFNNNYVFAVVNNHYREFLISDARLVGDTVYFTFNNYDTVYEEQDYKEQKHVCVLVLPKSEIGNVPKNVTVKALDVPIYVDGVAEMVDVGTAIIIALEDFYKIYDTTLPKDYICTAKQTVGPDDNYWYISIYHKYVGNPPLLEENVFNESAYGAFYTISKLDGSIKEVRALSQKKKIYTTELQMNYIFWYKIFAPTWERLATLVIDNGFLEDGFEDIVLPDDIVAGDIVTIKNTGEWLNRQVYLLSHWSLIKGEVVDFTVEYADVLHLTGEDFDISKIKENYDFTDNYVILDREGRFVTLDEYTGNEIYLVADQKRLALYNEGEKYPIACMLAYNPRDLEAGKPPVIEHNITEAQALEIARSHFYANGVREDCVYTVTVKDYYEDYWLVYFDEEPINGGVHIERSYCYTIHKGTGEIVMIEIAE